MVQMKRFLSTLVVFVFLISSSNSWAFLVPGEGVTNIEIRDVLMMVLHNGVEQTLIVSMDLNVEGDGEITWILPVPGPPSRVERAGEMLWNEATSTFQLSQLAPPKTRGAAGDDGRAARVIEGSDVNIASFPSRGDDARSKLIEDVGEAAKSLPLSYYSDQNWSFVRMKWQAKAGRQKTAPLVFDFKTPIPVAPVRSLSSKEGTKTIIFQVLGVPPNEEHYIDAHSKGAHIAKDRRRGSPWAIASNDWVMGRTIFYARDLKLLLRNHYTHRFSGDGRGYFQAVIFESLDTSQTRRWKEDLIFAPRGTSMLMTDDQEGAVAIDLKEDPTGVAEPDEQSGESDDEEIGDGDGVEETRQVADSSDSEPLDWTLVAGISVLVVVGGMIGILQLMRMR